MNGYTWKPTDVDPYVLGDTEFSYLEDILHLIKDSRITVINLIK